MALRTLRKNRLFTALNVLGLALGLAIAACLLLWIKNEWSFNRQFAQYPHICRIVLDRPLESGKVERMSNAPNVAGPAAKENIAAVQQYARLLANNFTGEAFVRTDRKDLITDKMVWADPGLAEIFGIKALRGDMEAALREPNSVAIDATTSARLFGNSDPVGQTLRIDRRDALVVRAVYPDFPDNSTLEARIMGSFVTEKWANAPLVWSNASFETWLLLAPDADRTAVARDLMGVYEKATPSENRWFSLWLQPLADAHWGSSDFQYSVSARSGDLRQVALLLGLAIAVLLIACFNYMNLSTAHAQRRAKEVGIRKTLGATALQISRLLISDFLKWVLLAIVLAVPVAWYFMQRWLADFACRIDLQWWMFAVTGAGVVVVALLTVSVQSVRAALINPVQSLRSE